MEVKNEWTMLLLLVQMKNPRHTVQISGRKDSEGHKSSSYNFLNDDGNIDDTFANMDEYAEPYAHKVIFRLAVHFSETLQNTIKKF